MPAIKPEEYQEWLLHPVTQALREQWHQDRERLKEELVLGHFSDPLEAANVRGQCAVLKQFYDLDHIEES